MFLRGCIYSLKLVEVRYLMTISSATVRTYSWCYMSKLSRLDDKEGPRLFPARGIHEMELLLSAVDELPPFCCCIPKGVLFNPEAERLIALFDEVVSVELDAVIRVGEDRQLA